MAFRLKEGHKRCPFDPSHQILPYRMAQHIVKCRKNHPDADMSVCVFNATHVVPSYEYERHREECPDRGVADRAMVRTRKVEDAMAVRSIHSNISPDPLNLGDEDWENELAEDVYKPEDKMMTSSFTRPPPPGKLGKSERKAWRQNEIDRVRRASLESISNRNYPDSLVSASSASLSGGASRYNSMLRERDVDQSLTASMSSLVMCADQPLRRPKALQENSRIAADTYHDSIDENSEACDDRVPLNISKTTPKNRKKKEAAKRRKQAEEDNKENSEDSPVNYDNSVPVANAESTGDSARDKEIKKIKKKLRQIAKLKILKSEGMQLEKDQLEKIKKEGALNAELIKIS